MVRLDSTKLEIPNEVIQGMNSAYFDTINRNKGGVLIQDTQEYKSKSLKGLKSILINHKTQNTTIEFSAKILGPEYIQGINKNTIESVVNEINSSGIIELSCNDFIDQALICRTDVTDNIKPENNTDLIYKTLASLPIAQKYHTSLYNRNTNRGVVYKGQQKTVRDRIQFYDKTKDLFKDKDFKNSGYYNKLCKDFEGVMRVESNHSKYKDIQKLFGSRLLKTALNSTNKINYNVFSRITDRVKDIDLRLFQEFEGMAFYEIRNYLGDKGIIELYDFDWQKIDLFIKSFNPHNYGRYKKDLIRVYNRLKQQNDTELKLIENIKQLLYAA